jgi:MFS family permease
MLMAIIGSPLGGWIADWWMRKKIQARLLVSAISALLSAVFYFCSLHLFSGGTVQYAILILGGIASMAFASSAIAVTQDVVHPGLRRSYALCADRQNLWGLSRADRDRGPLGCVRDRHSLEARNFCGFDFVRPLLPGVQVL